VASYTDQRFTGISIVIAIHVWRYSRVVV
jgi:hypothetical protein